jgi:hypothetical protein
MYYLEEIKTYVCVNITVSCFISWENGHLFSLC